MSGSGQTCVSDTLVKGTRKIQRRNLKKETTVDQGEQITGTRDEHYNLVSVLYHALNAADTCDRYALDAETAGDERLAAFFRRTQALQTGVAEEAKQHLGILEPPPEFGAASATGGSSTTAQGSTPSMPRSPLNESPEPGGL
jgi:hypothetical protein